MPKRIHTGESGGINRRFLVRVRSIGDNELEKFIGRIILYNGLDYSNTSAPKCIAATDAEDCSFSSTRICYPRKPSDDSSYSRQVALIVTKMLVITFVVVILISRICLITLTVILFPVQPLQHGKFVTEKYMRSLNPTSAYLNNYFEKNLLRSG